MRFRLKIFHKGLILVSVPLVFEITFVVVLVMLLQQAEDEIREEARAKDILSRVDIVRQTWTDLGFALAFYKFSHNEALRMRYDRGVKLIEHEQKEMAKIIDRKNPAEAEPFRQIVELTPLALKSMNEAMSADDMGGVLRGFGGGARNFSGGELRRTGSPLYKMRLAADRLADVQVKLTEKSPLEKAHTRSLIQQALCGGLAVNVGLTVLLTFYLSRSITGRLACVTDNTLKLAKRQALNPPVGGSDEIAILDNCLHSTANELAELENFKRDMMSMVSHELRTPLASVALTLQLLSEGVLGAIPDKALSKVKMAETSAERLIRLINDLLDIDRMQAGKLEMTFKESSIDALLDQAVDSVVEFARKSQVVIMRDGHAGPCVVDPERLVQVVINLLSNAIKFSPPESTVELVAVDSTEFLEVRVVDHGRGIPAGFKDKVFEKFQQVNQSDAREKKGSGLGLAICKAIIEQHHGEIGVESEEGKGSTFWFRVPKVLLPAVSPASATR